MIDLLQRRSAMLIGAVLSTASCAGGWIATGEVKPKAASPKVVLPEADPAPCPDHFDPDTTPRSCAKIRGDYPFSHGGFSCTYDVGDCHCESENDTCHPALPPRRSADAKFRWVCAKRPVLAPGCPSSLKGAGSLCELQLPEVACFYGDAVCPQVMTCQARKWEPVPGPP